MTRRVELAPSLLSADFGRMAEATRLVRAAGLKYLHLDVMDGHFVPGITFGAKMVADLRKEADGLKIIAHLMVAKPLRFVGAFAAAGADYITVHAETARSPQGLTRLLNVIKKEGKRAGVALNPRTMWRDFESSLEVADLVLVMMVSPGAGGQALIPACLKKVTALRDYLDEIKRPDVLIEVDGGVKLSNVRQIARAGADIIVAGSAVFGAGDPARALAEFKKVLNSQEPAASPGLGGDRFGGTHQT